MKRCVIESPYAGDVEANKAYLVRCIRDSVDRGESPYASHRMLTDSLDDSDTEQRSIGIRCGYAWWRPANVIAFYCDRGISTGMLLASDMVAQHWGTDWTPFAGTRVPWRPAVELRLLEPITEKEHRDQVVEFAYAIRRSCAAHVRIIGKAAL